MLDVYPQVAHRSCLRAWAAVATQRISLCRWAPSSALKAGSHVMRWPGTLGARGPPLQRPRAGVSRMALPRHHAAKARLQQVVPGLETCVLRIILTGVHVCCGG